MIDFIVGRQELLKPLAAFSSMVEYNNTVVILANILLKVEDDDLVLTASNLNVEIKTSIKLKQKVVGQHATTISAQKLLEIVRLLPENSDIHFIQEKDRINLRCGDAKYNLLTLDADNFPLLENEVDNELKLLAEKSPISFSIEQSGLKYILDKTHFSMANKDVRRALNGLLLDIDSNKVKAISTDGHRLSYCEINNDNQGTTANTRVIIPRRSVIDLMRIIDTKTQHKAQVIIVDNYVKIILSNYIFITKLLIGNFPDYQHLLGMNLDKKVVFNRQELINVLHRTKVLTGNRCGINVSIMPCKAVFFSSNNYNEQAEENMAIDYQGDPTTLGLNVNYLLDIASVMDEEYITINFANQESGVLINGDKQDKSYIVMPMKF